MGWSASTTDEEARAYLQSRLLTLSKVMFFSFSGYLAFLWVFYWQYPHLKPHYNDVIFASAAVGLIILALLWRLLLARQALTIRQLYQIDTFYVFGTGFLFGLGTYLSTDFQPAPYIAFFYTALMVLTRATIVPSTGVRTFVMSSVAFAPFLGASIAIGATQNFYLPPTALVAGTVMFGFVVILLAATGSQIAFGLRQHARTAMQLGQYTLGRKIGEGGMGSVYIAHHVLLRRPTAIKLLRPERVGNEAMDRFEHEVQHMSQLSHPNTVAVFDYGHSPDGYFYYAMEYLDGIDLEKLVQKYGKQSPSRVAAILAQVCGALAEAHGRGLVHRDIKPANIILCERGGIADVAKVVDFGLVKQLTADTGDSKQIIIGTPTYLAPEAVTDVHTVGPPADIYALGAVGFYMLEGRRPFDGKNPLEVCVQHVTAPMPPLDAPAPLAALIRACMDKAPANRPTADALARALRALVLLDDWDEERARDWWSRFREQTSPGTLSDPTLTITIDLANRSRRSVRAHMPAD